MIAKFARFDLDSLLASRARVVGPLIFVVLMGAVNPFPLLSIPAAAAAVSLSAGTPFLNDERGRLDMLYATLPISRATVVMGRYLEMALWYAVATALATLTTFVASAARGEAVQSVTLVLTLTLSFAAVAATLAVQLPLFFALGFTRARTMMFVPVVIIGAVCSIAAGIGAGSAAFKQAGASALIPVLAIVIGVVLAGSSVVVAARLYSRREL